MAASPAPSPHHRRATPRAELECAVTLTRRRRHGSREPAPLSGQTHDLGPGGMRISCARPLKMDEQLDFSVRLDDGSEVCGCAHVVRVAPRQVYALCIDTVPDADGRRLWELASG